MASKVVAVLAAAVLLVAAAVMGGAGVASAQACNIGELAAVCKSAFVGGSPPTAACCAKLRSHETCFCKYQSNPKYGSYINNPNTPKTLASCGIALPNC